MGTNEQHDQEQLITEYLLGTLPEDKAEELEQVLLCDESFFERQLLPAESALIRQYLDGSMPASQQVAFENKYLVVPELHKKVELARRMRVAASDPFPRREIFGFDWIMVAAMALCALGIGSLVAAWIVVGHSRERASHQTQGTVQVGSSLGDDHILFSTLHPGLTMSADDRPQRVVLPPQAAEIRLAFELTEILEQAEVTVQIFQIGGRSRRLVWSREHVPCVRTLRGQTVLISLSKELLTAGDYITYLKRTPNDPDRQAIESYSFGVIQQ